MVLVENWRDVLKASWSMRLTYLASLLGAIELALPLFADVVPRGWFIGASLLLSFLVPLARIVAQPSLHEQADTQA